MPENDVKAADGIAARTVGVGSGAGVDVDWGFAPGSMTVPSLLTQPMERV
jgi:hypothetical protein